MRNAIRIKTITVLAAVFSTQLLIGCSGNLESVFFDKLKAEIDKEGERCYNVNNFLDLEMLENGGKLYLAVIESDMKLYKEQQARGVAMVERLKQAGYVDGSKKKLSYRYQDYMGYGLNEKGRKHILLSEGLCVGHRNITGIVDYTEPKDLMGSTFTQVTYKYDVVLNDIVSDLGLEDKVKAKLPGEGKANFVKTNKGWRLE